MEQDRYLPLCSAIIRQALNSCQPRQSRGCVVPGEALLRNATPGHIPGTLRVPGMQEISRIECRVGFPGLGGV